jgi:hypothetical protein
MYRLLLTLGLGSLAPGMAFAVEVDIIKRFNMIQSLMKIKIQLPEGFFLNPKRSDDVNLALSEPVSFRGDLVRAIRYSHERYPFASIALTSYFKKYTPDMITMSEDKEKRIKLIGMEHKTHGESGLILHVMQWAHGRWFEAWIAIFGNRRQTAVISGVFPQEYGQVLSRIMRRTVEYAAFTSQDNAD